MSGAAFINRQNIRVANIDLANIAGTYDILTPTINTLFRVHSFYCITAGAGLTSVSVQTDNTTPDIILTAVEGAVAALTALKNLTYAFSQKPFGLLSGKKLQYTIVGTGSAGSIVMIYEVMAELS